MFIGFLVCENIGLDFIQVLRPLGDQDIIKIVFGGDHFEIQDGGCNCRLSLCVLLLYERVYKSSHVYQFSHFFTF